MLFGLQNGSYELQVHTAPATCTPVSHDSSVCQWPHRTREEEEAAVAHAVCCCWLANYRSVVDHGCFKASRAAVRDWTTPLAAGPVGRDSHSAGSGCGVPVEPEQDEGEERYRGAENTRRQRQSRAGPRRRSTSQPGAGEHGNVTPLPRDSSLLCC